jgi:hypothetical protein
MMGAALKRLSSKTWLLVIPAQLGGQAGRTANPERPTVATHAYAVAPGFIEVEQGVSARGTEGLRQATSWDVNVKLGVTGHIQLGLFGPLFLRTGTGHGPGDWGAALKVRTAISDRVAVAVVPAASFPTGRAGAGLGAGRVLGQLVGVVSADGPAGVHVDLNAGPLGVGAGRPQWLTTASFGRAFGRWGTAAELFRIGAGDAGARQAGLLGAVTFAPAPWIVIDGGGIAGLGAASPGALFLGITTNLGHL